MAKNRYAILILAAGGSKRLGHPKQLVRWNQSTLLNNTIEQALKCINCDVFVAVGSNKANVVQSISSDVNLIPIPNWEEGMGTSISSSLSQMDKEEYEATIISVCDQPYISDAIFHKLLNEYEQGEFNIIISKYNSNLGPPTLFQRKYYSELLLLEKDLGAKEIVKNNSDDLACIQFPKGDIDIDTEIDVNRLNGS